MARYQEPQDQPVGYHQEVIDAFVGGDLNQAGGDIISGNPIQIGEVRDSGAVFVLNVTENALRPLAAPKNTALYQPFIHFRDDAWLKCAALYWPVIGRMVPRGYRTDRDSDTVRELADAGIIVNIPPHSGTVDTAHQMARFVRKNETALTTRYALDRHPDLHDQISISPGGTPQPKIAWIHTSKIEAGLSTVLQDAGLAQHGRDHDTSWLGMHPHLASLYMKTLAETIAAKKQMVALTDTSSAFGSLNGWTIETLGAELLGNRTPCITTDEVRSAFVTAALTTVMPANLAHLPASEIISARKDLNAEFQDFRRFVISLDHRFQQIATADEPALALAEVEADVNREIRAPLSRLRRSMHHRGWRAIPAILSRKIPARTRHPYAGVFNRRSGPDANVAIELILNRLGTPNPSQAIEYLHSLDHRLNPHRALTKLRARLGN